MGEINVALQRKVIELAVLTLTHSESLLCRLAKLDAVLSCCVDGRMLHGTPGMPRLWRCWFCVGGVMVKVLARVKEHHGGIFLLCSSIAKLSLTLAMDHREDTGILPRDNRPQHSSEDRKAVDKGGLLSEGVALTRPADTVGLDKYHALNPHIHNRNMRIPKSNITQYIRVGVR